MKKISFTVLLVPLGLLLFSSSPSTSAAADARANTGFIGAITCKDCHERQYETYARSVHFQKSVKGP
ncbi:MAG: cytochrome c family protein, partial [Desulfobulbaceae bacterium]|nr:cytochrome c family protein [Desulfobulbaceae bacterium]